jgi:SH3-like domain-containing protein
MKNHRMAQLTLFLVLLLSAGLLSGCGVLFGGEEEAAATPTSPPRTIVPTFTPTPVQAATATPEPVAMQATQVITVGAPAAAPAAVTGTLTNTAATTGTATVTGTAGLTDTAGLTGTTALTATGAVTVPAPPAAASTISPMLEIETDIINVRSGPGTTFGLVGTANLGERFEIKGRNADATWYLICCVNGQQGWVSAELADEENEELAQLVEVPTPAPQAQAPAPTQPPAAPPAEATATPAPAPPPAGDDCAGIGGDGCKFKLRGGPTFANNGGNELKFQIAFVHSGVEGGQPQGSYFVWVEKDGQKLPVSDSVRSISLQAQQGPQGKYNYEYKIGRDQLPGGSVAGTYRIWVLDGNGERDSQTFTFTVPEGQGEVWILFDQA